MPHAQTIIDILWQRAADEPDRIAYSFLHSRSGDRSMTYGQLASAVRQLAAWLQENATPHRRAVLVYPPGLELIIALFGSMVSGILPIPVYPLIGSNAARNLARIRHIASDADSSLILTTAELLPGLLTQLSGALPGSTCLATDQIPEDRIDHRDLPSTDSSALAVLQYTSGSTALPKGVQITHANLMANSAAIHDCYKLNSDTRIVSWLPPYHDMGLIGGIIQPLYGGVPVTLMSPHSFIHSPIRWLEAISRTRATASPAPNFGYDLCVRKVSQGAVAGLDLSSWTEAICGAELVNRLTLEQFARKFEPAGFRMKAFCPSYGLAEATLLVSASAGAVPLVQSFDRDALERGKVEACSENNPNARLLVGNGPAAPGVTIRIVDQASLSRCPDGQAGEVWTTSASTSSGYWNKPELNAVSFGAYLADSGEGPFLRTGDVGFFHKGQLFIAGRIKDLIILGGKNHFPEDIELTVRESHPAFEGMPGAAFSVEVDGQEMLVVLQEMTLKARKADLDPEDLFRHIHRALFTNNVRADAIVLLRTSTIAKTTSGKVQRHQCRKDFLQNKLEVFAEKVSPAADRARAARPA